MAMSCGVDHRHGWDPQLLRLWCRPAAAGPIGSLAWEPPYVASAALKKKNKQTKQKTNKQTKKPGCFLFHCAWELPYASIQP